MFVKVFHGLLTGKMCRSFYEGLFSTHADSFYFLCTSIIVGQKLVDVCLSLLAYRSSWLKFLVLISFPCYAGFFNHPQLDTKEHDRLKHETRDRYQS